MESKTLARNVASPLEQAHGDSRVLNFVAMNQPETHEAVEPMRSADKALVRADDPWAATKQTLRGAFIGASVVALAFGIPIAWKQAENGMDGSGSFLGHSVRAFLGLPPAPDQLAPAPLTPITTPAPPLTRGQIKERRRPLWDVPENKRGR